MQRGPDEERGDVEDNDREDFSEADRAEPSERPAVTASQWEPGADAGGNRATAPRVSEDAQTYTVEHALNRLMLSGCIDNARGTVECYRQRGGHVLRLLGDILLLQLTLDHVHWYITKRLDEGASRETVRKETVVLRRALELARVRGVIWWSCKELMPRFRVRYVPRRRWLTSADFERLLAEFPPERQRWLLLATYGGLRSSEVEKVEGQHVDLQNRALAVPGTKTAGSCRRIPMHPRLQEELEREPLPLSGPLAKRWANVRREIALACVRLRIERVSPNDLRRTFASWLKQASVDSFVVAQLLGHSSSRMVEMVYGRIDFATLEKAVGELPASEESKQ